MSAVLRDRGYRISGWGTTSDWVVLRRERDGNVHLSSASLQTTIIAHESKLIETVVADRDAELSPPSLFLGPGDARQMLPAAAGLGIGSPFDPAASSAAFPGVASPAQQPPPLRGQPLARTSDPQTAHDAANVAKSSTAANRLRVLIAHRDAGERGLTGDELAAATGEPYAVIGPRRPSLAEDGLIVATNVRRPSNRGVMQQVFCITEAGRITADSAAVA